MGNFKRVMAVMLVLMLSVCFAFSALAAGSPTGGNTTPDTVVAGVDTQTTPGNTLTFTTVNGVETVTSVKATAGTTTVCFVPSESVSHSVAGVTNVGDGTNGVFDNKEGQDTVGVVVNDAGSTTVFNPNAYKGSNVQNITIATATEFRKDAFKGAKNKKVTITVLTKDMKGAKNAFSALSKKSKIRVSKKAMSKKAFKKFQKNLKKWGFKGKVKRF